VSTAAKPAASAGLTKRRIENFGWQRDLPDHRDRIYNEEETILQGAQLPSKFSLRGSMPPVYDQGQLGSCTANAIAAVLEHQEMAEGEGEETPSRLFIYYGEREIEGTIGQDSGAQIRDGIKVVAKLGAPPESDCPYEIAKFTERPSAKSYEDAQHYRAVAYQRIIPGGTGAPIRTAVHANHPVSFGFSVPAVFEEEAKWNPATQALPLPDAEEHFIGGHAVAIVGWDYTKERFPVEVLEIRNSWGPKWGDAGYFFMDARWFPPGARLTSDFWVISLVGARHGA
jgi:C1A family cysteine protease